VMNLVSLLVLPAVISLRHSDVRYVIAGVALVVLLAAIAFSKRRAPGLDVALPPAGVAVPATTSPVSAPAVGAAD
ncbi:MAG: hypothetical protein ACRDV8_04310, partial [Acidimicrobiales bacterium]